MQPVFQAFATTKLADVLHYGDTVNLQYFSDLAVNNMGGNGSYVTQAMTDTNESLVVNQNKEVSVQIPDWQTFLMHLPTRQKYAERAMARIWNFTDGQILQSMQTNAATIVDDGTLAGTAGNPIAAGIGNVLSMFASAHEQLLNQGIEWIPGKSFAGVPHKEKIACAVVPPRVFNYIEQFMATKNSALGDRAATEGFIGVNKYVGMFAGFNLFVSGALPWDSKLTFTTNPTAEDTITLNTGVNKLIAGSSTSTAVTFEFATTPSAAGEIIVGDTLAHTLTNAANAMSAPYTSISNTASAGFTPFVAVTSANVYQQLLLNALSAVATATTLKISVFGFGNIPIAISMTTATNVITNQVTHCIFGTNDSVALIMKREPNTDVNFVSGAVAKDFITWNVYGFKVFNYQTFQLVDAWIDASVTGWTQSQFALF